MNQIKILEKIWKSGLAVLVASVLSLGGLFLSLPRASAHGNPNMVTKLLVNDVSDSPDAGWVHNLNSQAGRRVQFYVEIHNTIVGTSAHDVTAKVNFPGGTSTSLSIPLTVTSGNANTASDNVTINIPAPGARISYVAGSTRLTWDQNGDGVKEFNNTKLSDGVVGSGIRIGNQSGCNEFIIQLSFLADLVGSTPSPTPSPSPSPSPSPTPSPSPSPSPSPTPPCTTCGSTNNNDNNNDIDIDIENNQTQTQNVNVTTAAVPVKQPETGAGVLGLATMFSAAPIGLALARYGRGRITTRKEENLAGIAKSLVESRQGKNTQV